jgi:hypothetical protein
LGRGIRATVSVGAAIAFCGIATSGAAAAKLESTYKPNIAAYQASAVYHGTTCAPGTTCPGVTNSLQPSGGVDGGAFLRTAISSPFSASANSSGVWESAPFSYNGAKGEVPEEVSLVLFRRATTSALLDVSGNTATYTAQIVDQRVGTPIASVPIDGRPLSPASDWTAVTADVPPARLRIGHKYALVITSTFNTGAEAFPGATADYDRIALDATAPKPAPPPPPPPPNPKHFHRLVVKAKCPRHPAARTCLLHIIAFKHPYSGPRVTLPKTVRKRGHSTKRISLRVKPDFERYAKKLAKARKRLPVHLTVAAQHQRHSSNRMLKAVAYH